MTRELKTTRLVLYWYKPGVAFTHFVGTRTGLSSIVRLPNTPQYMIYRPLCQLYMGTTRLDRAWDGFLGQILEAATSVAATECSH